MSSQNFSVNAMEPLLIEENREAKFVDLITELLKQSAALSARLNPIVNNSIGDLVRSMNCYYSNLIEDHNTHPRDIDRALANHFSKNPIKRTLQKEARSHIRVQEKIDKGVIQFPVISLDFIKWIHYEFCHSLPEELLRVENPDTGEVIPVIPGEFRTRDVAVGRHIPPQSESLTLFLNRFVEAYSAPHYSIIRKVLNVAASHHRLLWIHPFIDGNGRVARLFSHALFKEIGMGSSLWSVARGLARKVNHYKSSLQDADSARRGPLDGRGTLSLQGLEHFCFFFLETCLDQISYMDSLLQLPTLSKRMEHYVQGEVALGKLTSDVWPLLKAALFEGEIERGRAADITGYKERQARTLLKSLTDRKLLISDTPKGAVRLHFPFEVLEAYFPQLYPGL